MIIIIIFFLERGMNETTLTILALTAYFTKLSEVGYTITQNVDHLHFGSFMLQSDARELLQDLAIRYIRFTYTTQQKQSC